MAKRILSALIPFSFFLITFSASAAIPVRWTVDTFRVKPLVYECYHGETLDLAAAMTAYGEPLDLHGKTARLYWQTNGMDSAYWSTNATITTSQTSQTPQTSQTTNVLQATFVGSFDPGAPSVNGFIGVEGENYRAAFQLNFRPSPGFAPAHLQVPTPVIDFATTAVAHPEASPFMVKGGSGGIDAATATNIASAVVAPVASTQSVHAASISSHTSQLSQLSQSKQDLLPYPTNEIPWSVIANAPEVKTDRITNATSVITASGRWETRYNETASAWTTNTLCTVAEAQQKANTAETRAKNASRPSTWKPVWNDVQFKPSLYTTSETDSRIVSATNGLQREIYSVEGTGNWGAWTNKSCEITYKFICGEESYTETAQSIEFTYVRGEIPGGFVIYDFYITLYFGWIGEYSVNVSSETYNKEPVELSLTPRGRPGQIEYVDGAIVFGRTPPFYYYKSGDVADTYPTNGSHRLITSGGVCAAISNLTARIDAKQNALNEAGTNAITSGITSAKVATYDGYATGKENAGVAASYFAANADYALTNLTVGASPVHLSSGEIGNANMTADLAVTLDFSQAANRSGDCLLYLINATANDHDIVPTQTNDYTFVSTDLAKALTIGKATTNIVMFSRLKSDTIMVSKQEVK